MNDDLHDIDKLFRDGINEHHEPLPPSVWEGVTHSLDLQQAAHFRRKYYKLRRWLLLLLLLSGASSGFFFVDKWKQRKGTNEPSSVKTAALNKDRIKAGDEKSITKQSSPDAVTKDELDKSNQPGKTIVEKPALKETDSKNSIDKTEEQLTSLLKTNPVLVVQQNATSDNNTVSNKKVDKGLSRKVTVQPGITKTKNSSSTQNQLAVFESTKKFFVDAIQTRDHFLLISLKEPMIAKRKNSLTTNDDKSKNKKGSSVHELSLTAFAAPNFSFGRLEDDDHLSAPGRNRRDFHKEESDAASFSAGLLVGYGLTKKISLEVGLIYTYSATNIGPKTVYAKTDGGGNTRYELNCSSGSSYISPKGTMQPAVGDSARVSGGTSALHYLTVPAAVSFAVHKGRFTIRPSIGVAGNFLLAGNTQASLNYAAGTETSSNSITGLKTVYLDGRFGVGADYMLSNKLSIGIRPSARIGLTSINRETPVRSYQNYLSVEAGLRIKL